MSVISPITFRLHATDDRFSITDGIRKWGISSVCTAHTKCSAYVDNRCLHNNLCVFKYEYESFHIYIYTYIVMYKTSPVWFSFSFVVLFSSQLFVVYCIHNYYYLLISYTYDIECCQSKRHKARQNHTACALKREVTICLQCVKCEHGRKSSKP